MAAKVPVPPPGAPENAAPPSTELLSYYRTRIQDFDAERKEWLERFAEARPPLQKSLSPIRICRPPAIRRARGPNPAPCGPGFFARARASLRIETPRVCCVAPLHPHLATARAGYGPGHPVCV